jgi:ligand-binding SRPBCC domain-containing protein
MSDVEISTVVAAPQPVVWERIAIFEGVNHELGPWLRMTAPDAMRTIGPEQVPLGRRWFRSWVLLLGVIPVDYDDLVIVEIDPGAGFLERSRMLTMKVWQHDRRLNPEGQSTRVTDRLTFTPRRLVPKPLARSVVGFLFRHRHRRLGAWFSASGPAP